MKKKLLFICWLIFPLAISANSVLSVEQKAKAESAVKNYFTLLARYAAQPMGAEALDIRNDIVSMFENMYNAPVYNDLLEFKTITNMEASCTIDDYLLSFGLLNDKESCTFQISCDSIECQSLQEPSYAQGYNDLNALVYVRKFINGGGISKKITNVIRYNLNTDKISYIEKASFSTNDEDVKFLLKNNLGYSTAKLRELAGRCFQEKKYKQAYQLYEQAAIRDDMDAQYALANMLWKRQGCDEYGVFATINMTKFWLKKIYFKYIDNKGVKLFDIGIYKPVQDMMDIVFYDDFNASSDKEDRPFNSGLMKYYTLSGKKLYGFLNTKGEVVIPLKYSSVSAFSDGLARVSINNKWGYLDSKGEIVISAIYDYATDFINGTASVSLTDTIEGKFQKRFFIINKKGKQISETFDYLGWRDRKEEMLILAKRGDKWGFVNGLGKIKIPFIYDAYHKHRAYENASTDHFTAICQNGKWGFIDTSSSEGKIIVPPQYVAVGDFLFGMAWVSDGRKFSFIDKTGTIVCGGYVSVTPFNASGLSCVKTSMNTTEAYLINKRGEIVFYCDKDEKGNLSNLRRKE